MRILKPGLLEKDVLAIMGEALQGFLGNDKAL
jgi:hypothetical protein